MSAPTVQTIETIGGGVATPQGFRAAGVSAGIKAKPGALDLALLVSDQPATAAAVFTTNLAQAAPVIVSREHLSPIGRGRAGNRRQQRVRQRLHRRGRASRRADDGRRHGAPGRLPGRAGARRVDRRHWRRAPDGQDPERDCRRRSTPLGAEQGSLAAQAIMTTDPFPKGSGGSRQHRRPRDHDRRHGQRLGHDRADDGDDARVRDDRCGVSPRPLLERALREVVNDTFNAITVDGECSTNDCVMILANGASGVTVDERQLRRVRRRAAMPSACGWRSASCAAAKARPSWSP